MRLHSSERVREKAAVGIKPTDEQGLRACLELSRDAFPRVREWSLLWLSDAEVAASVEVQQRLVEALADADFTCRAEAMCGLAAIRSPGIQRTIEAALGDVRLEDDAYGRGRLEDALERITAAVSIAKSVNE
jgi:hypothetical protein